MGSPRALTTRPSRASPTGTDRIRPVARTVWPSSSVVDLAEHHRPDGVLVQVEGQPDDAALELQQLVDGGVGQPGDPGDAVVDLLDPSHLLGGHSGREPGDVASEGLGDVRRR